MRGEGESSYSPFKVFGLKFENTCLGGGRFS
jgi:hypothetical protein